MKKTIDTTTEKEVAKKARNRAPSKGKIQPEETNIERECELLKTLNRIKKKLRKNITRKLVEDRKKQ